MPTRGLTSGEIALGRSVYGESIDYSVVTVSTRGAVGNMGYTPDNTINIGALAYSPDFSKESVGSRAFFAHELSHVRDFQATGERNTIFSSGAGRDYNYSDKISSGNFDINTYTIEERAQIYQDEYLSRFGLTHNVARGGLFGRKEVYEIPPREVLQVIISSDKKDNTPIPTPRPAECFLAGTMIDMWPLDLTPGVNRTYDQQEVLAKVWQKPIEEITREDWVISYDDEGRLKPGRVARTFQNHSRHILDVHGLMMTPGHVTLCAKVEGEENPFAGRHVPIIDVLRSDGAIAKADGRLIRASTGYEVGSEEDRLIPAFAKISDAEAAKGEQPKLGHIRLGTRYIGNDGRVVGVTDIIDRLGGKVCSDGLILLPNGSRHVYVWTATPSLPRPEDYVLQRSQVTLEEIYEAGEWEAASSQMPMPVVEKAGRSFRRNNAIYAGATSVHLSPNLPLRMRNSPNQPAMSRQQRRALERKRLKATKAKKRSNPTVH